MKKLATRLGESLYDAASGLDKKQAEAAGEQLVSLLRARRQLGLLPEVIRAYEAKAKRERGVETVGITTSVEPSAKYADEVRTALEKAVGGEIEISWKSDPALIGGAVIRHGDSLLDTSVKRKLELLKQRLN